MNRHKELVAELYEEWAGDVQRYIHGYVRDHHAAEDLTQQTFANILRAIPKYEDRDGRMAAWVKQIARNAVIDHYRKNRKYTLQADPAAFRPAPGGRAEASDALRDAFDALDEDQRIVTMLRHVAGLGPQEIADRTGRSVSSVNGLHNRGRKVLQRELAARELAPTTV